MTGYSFHEYYIERLTNEFCFSYNLLFELSDYNESKQRSNHLAACLIKLFRKRASVTRGISVTAELS